MNFLAFDKQYREFFKKNTSDSEKEADALSLIPHQEEESPKYYGIAWQQQLEESAMARRKFKLWEEGQGMCIYCGKSITAEDFINGVDSDIEHIIPHALGGQSLLDNLAVSCRECNRAKGGLTAIDYMLSLPPEELQDYMKRLRLLATAGSISPQKYLNLTTPRYLLTHPQKLSYRKEPKPKTADRDD